MKTNNVLDETIEYQNKIDRKRTEIAECLFSVQRHYHQLSNARKLVVLSSELAELVATYKNIG